MNKSVLDPAELKGLATRSQRQRILDAMAACCAEKTFASTTISDIVGHAGVSRATFYKQFDNKRHCFDAAVNYVIGELQAAGRSAHSGSATESENVRRAIVAVLALMESAPAYTRLVMIEAVAVDPKLMNRFRALVVEGIAAARGHSLNAQSPDSASRTAFGQAQVLIANQILTGREGALSDLLPDLVYIALLPFTGPEEALKQARLAR
jgi:AcrR family transcriptional regulator